MALASLGTIVLWQHAMPKLGQTRVWARRLALVPGAVVALVGFALYSGAKLRAMRKAKLAAVK